MYSKISKIAYNIMNSRDNLTNSGDNLINSDNNLTNSGDNLTNSGDNILKTGASSIVISDKFYKHTFGIKKNKLLKITKKRVGHNERRYLDIIRNITNSEYYYCVPENMEFLLQPTDNFYSYLYDITKYDRPNIFSGNLHMSFVDYAGDKDLFDSINEIQSDPENTIWLKHKDILVFAKHILKGLSFLHQESIAHLDIKPENIMVNCSAGWRKNKDFYKSSFKIIDFGFASVYPFDDFIQNIKGTPGYIPKKFSAQHHEITPWLPDINANDFSSFEGKYPAINDRHLVYKIDSFCLGRVLYFLKNIFEEEYKSRCLILKNKTKHKLEVLINSLLCDNVYDRLTPYMCLEKLILD